MQKPNPPAKPLDGRGLNVLFIEDDAMNRRVVADMLQVAGATMVEAVSAEVGLELIDAQRFDVVLVDLRMPGMDGITAVRLVRERIDTKRRVPIIVVTADTSEGLHERCMAAGADAVIFKPVAMSELFETLGRVLASRKNDPV